MPKIRKFVFLKRKDGLDQRAFSDAWRNHNASALVAMDGFWSHAARYHQNIVKPAIEGFTPEPLWDGVVQIELTREAAAPERVPLDPFNQSVGPAQDEFIDQTRGVQFLAEEKVVLDGPARGIKILSLPRRKAGLSPAEFSRHYRQVHGKLVSNNEAFVTHCNRYVQHHALPETVKSSADFVPYDGISEFWFDSIEKARAAWSAPSYLAELRADEMNFVGSPPSHRLLVEESEIKRA